MTSSDQLKQVVSKRKRAYFVHPEGEGMGLGIIANSSKEAKKLAQYNDFFSDTEFIDIRVEWKKEIPSEKLKDLEVGEVEIRKGFELGLFDFSEDDKCDICLKDKTVYRHEKTDRSIVVMCNDCEDKEIEKEDSPIPPVAKVTGILGGSI